MTKFFIALVILSIGIAQAEPAPEGLIYHQKSCAFYWAGDECAHYPVPAGWKELYPNSKCKDHPTEKFCYMFNAKTCRGDAKKCCKDLGLKFVKIKSEPIRNTSLEECKATK